MASRVNAAGTKYGQDRNNSSIMDCSLFVCNALGHPHDGASGGGGHLVTGDLDGNSDFRALGKNEAAQPGDVLWQPRRNGGAHVGIFTGEKNSKGGLLGMQMGNSGASVGVWGLPIQKGVSGMGWFEGADKLVIYRPQRPR